MLTMVLGGLWHGAAWTFVLWGALHGAGLVVEHALARPAARARRGCAWFVTSTSSCSAGSCSAPRPRRPPGDFLGQLVDRRARRRCGRVPVGRCSIVVVIGLQLLPERAVERFRLRFERLSPAPLGAGLAAVDRSSSPRPCPPRACRPSSTSSSEACPTRDDSRRPASTRDARSAPRARRRSSRRRSRALLLVLAHGRLDPRAPASEMDPGSMRDLVLAVGKPGGLARRRAAVRRRGRRRRPPACRPTRTSTAAGALRGPHERRARAASRRSPPTRSTRARSAPSRAPHAAAAARCSSPATRCPAARRRARAARSPGDGVAGRSATRTRHRHLEDRPARLGQAVGATRSRKDKPDAVVVFIGANEGFPMRPPAAGARVLRGRLGRRVRHPRADDDGHLPAKAPRARLLAHAADAARRDRATIARAVNAAIARRRRALPRPGPRGGHRSVFTPDGRYPRRDDRRRPRAAWSANPTGSTSTRGRRDRRRRRHGGAEARLRLREMSRRALGRP